MAADNLQVTYQIASPTPFNFKDPAAWPRWIRRFERFRLASGLSVKDDVTQVNALVYSMGDDADDILTSFGLTEEERQDYDTVKGRFEGHFVVRRNVIFERAKFNSRRQAPGESVDAFLTDLYCLIEHCNYGPLKDDMLRDRIVAGLSDSKLAESLQLDSQLTLEKAVDRARQSEAVKKQQHVVRGEDQQLSGDLNVDGIRRNTSGKGKYKQKPTYTGGNSKVASTTTSAPSKTPSGGGDGCRKCGRSPKHPVPQCPARNATCFYCKKRGHFAPVCESRTRIRSVQEDVDAEADEFFLGHVTNGDISKWCVDVRLQGSEINFKIDTGADVTVISDAQLPNNTVLQTCTKKLFGPCGTELNVQGEFTGLLTSNKTEAYQTIYVVKGLQKALLGRPAVEALQLVLRVDSVSRPEDAFPELFSGLGKLKGEYAYTIKLKQDAKPFSLACPRRVPLPQLADVKTELQRMQELGVISPVEQPTEWCSGMVVVQKPSGGIRICVDYTHLNKSVQRERYILPSVDHTLGNIAGSTYFSKLDANNGFWQIPLDEESSLLTTFITPFGRFAFNRLPFGISSAPEVFQRIMTKIMEGLEGIACQMDDNLISAANLEAHDQRLYEALRRVKDSGLTLNKEKCKFRKTEIDFLGHRISATGIQPSLDKIAAIRDMGSPTSVTELKRFLGMAHYLGKFIPNLASISEPLTALLRTQNAWTWDTVQQDAFETIKQCLIRAPVLAFYDCLAPTRLTTDSSVYGAGAVLEQQQSDSSWKVVAYASKTLSETQRRYSQIEKEAYGITWECEKYRDYLLGRDFHIVTDHKPLVPLLSVKNLDELSPRIQRFRMRLMRFTYTISHSPGKEIVVADTLSRAPLSSAVPDDLDEIEVEAYVQTVMDSLPVSTKRLQSLKTAQVNDEVCTYLRRTCLEGWKQSEKSHPVGKLYWPFRGELSVVDDILLHGSRIVVPQSLQKGVLDDIHDGHWGISKCKARAQQVVWWLGLGRDIAELVAKCKICCKFRKETSEPLIPSKLPQRPWEKIAADLMTWQGQDFLVVTDYFSRFPFVLKLNSTTSQAIICQLKSLFSVHGIPDELMSDNGPQFASAEFQQFASRYKFQHFTSSPRYPQSNGLVESSVKLIKAVLNKSEDPHIALLNYRATPLQHGPSPAELLMGRRLRTPLISHPETLKPGWPDLAKFAEADRLYKEKQKSNFDKAHRTSSLPVLKPGDQVWIPQAQCSGQIISTTPYPRSYLVETSAGTLRRNRCQLRSLPVDPDRGSPSLDRESSSASPLTNNEETPGSATNSNIGSEGSSDSLRESYRTRSGRILIAPRRLDL